MKKLYKKAVPILLASTKYRCWNCTPWGDINVVEVGTVDIVRINNAGGLALMN